MTDIKWGPAIAVDGKRPGWLKGTDTIDVQEDGNDFYGVAMEDRSVVWHDDLNAIRLPADHPHYRQTEETPIDWSKPIEAVHEDGDVIPVVVAEGPDSEGDYRLTQALESENQALWFKADGQQLYGLGFGIGTRPRKPWRIRNVPQPTPQADTKPDLTARMEAVMREYARGCNDLIQRADGVHRTTFSEALAIVAQLSEPVDPDLIEARGVCAGIAHRRGDPGLAAEYTAGELDRQFEMEAVVATIRGRALALAGEKEA